MENHQCKNNTCEYENKLNRTTRLAADERRYAQLWETIELPKLLGKTPK